MRDTIFCNLQDTYVKFDLRWSEDQTKMKIRSWHLAVISRASTLLNLPKRKVYWIKM